MKTIGLGILALAVGATAVSLVSTNRDVVGAEPSVEMLAQGGARWIRRPSPTTNRVTRTYRSYSVEPGSGTFADPPAMAAPTGQLRSYSGGTPSKRSKPSYMRADSKAKGKFHQ